MIGKWGQSWVWIVTLIAAIAAPWVFFNHSTGRQSGFVLSMLSQMGMMSILALSYNMLLGQAGLFSFCHATFFGIGGYATIHFLNMAGSGGLPAPMELIPVLSGFSGLGLAVVINYSLLDLIRPLGITVSGDNLFTEILSVPVARIGALLPFAMMIVILSFRPRGLMGTRDT